MTDTHFGLLYTAQTTVYFVFAGACFWRAWENHLQHHSIRKALMAMGAMFLLLGTTQGFRVWGRLYPVNEREMLNSGAYFWIQAGATTALVVLFFLLQAPKKPAD
jgi:hypothetical protein